MHVLGITFSGKCGFSAARNKFLAPDLFRVGAEESLQPATPVTVNLYPLARDIGPSMGEKKILA